MSQQKRRCRPPQQLWESGTELATRRPVQPTTAATPAHQTECDNASLSTVPRSSSAVKSPQLDELPCAFCGWPLTEPYGVFWMPAHLGSAGPVAVGLTLLHAGCAEQAYALAGELDIPTMEADA
jgi:hypothetical protein